MIMDNKLQQGELAAFIYSIDDMLESKYIMAEKKISAVLQALADSNQVFNLVAKCMVNFNFKAEWKLAMEKPELCLPTFDEDRLAFIFCLLKNIDDKKISLALFLDRFFGNTAGAYGKFCEQIVGQFKFLVIKLLEKNGEITIRRKQVRVYAAPEVEIGFEQLYSMLRQVEMLFSRDAKLKLVSLDRSELNVVLKAFMYAAQNRQLEHFKAYCIVLSRALSSCREARELVLQIQMIVNELTKE